MPNHFFRLLIPCLFLLAATTAGTTQDSQTRPQADSAKLRSWLENMVWHHHCSVAEVAQVSGLTKARISELLTQYSASGQTRPNRPSNKQFALPYPGGRHPRTGFLDGAIDPQRNTKLSVFRPWDDSSYVVMDVPEEIWSNFGITFLTHTHIGTLWTKQGVTLEPSEWKVLPDGNFQSDVKLPNRIEFGVKVIPLKDHLRMKMWLTNGTDDTLHDLRVQHCCMLKAATGFQQQDRDNKRFVNGYSLATAGDKICFAHPNPGFVNIIENEPTKPLKRDVDYFIRRLATEIERNTGVLADDALSEFRAAKNIYDSLRQ